MPRQVALTPREGSGELELEARGTVLTSEDRDAVRTNTIFSRFITQNVELNKISEVCGTTFTKLLNILKSFSLCA